MQRNESVVQNVEKTDEIAVQDADNQTQQVQSKSPSIKIESESPSPKYSEDQKSQKQQQQMRGQTEYIETKAQTSLENISIQSPVKKLLIKSQAKLHEKAKNSQTKISDKVDNNKKQRHEQETISNSKLLSESYIKSSIKSNQKLKKINKPFYEETFYITGMKENYLLLLSDTNQVLQFPIGMFTTQSQTPESQKRSEEGSNPNENFHLRKDIKIGQPIKIKLEFDFLRQEKDDRIFNSLQKTINEEYSEGNEEPLEIRSKELSIRKNK